jgi:hypothetical protein
MRPHFRWALSWAVLSAALLLATTPARTAYDQEDDKKIKAAQKDVLAFAGDVAKGKLDAKKALAIHKKYDELNHLMTVFKARERKGIGYGPSGEAIEGKLNKLGKFALKRGDLNKEAAQLLRMAYINLALAEIGPHYAPPRPNDRGKGAKEWKQYTAEWKVATTQFIAAVKKRNPDMVKKAANDITSTCNSCHADFR